MIELALICVIEEKKQAIGSFQCAKRSVEQRMIEYFKEIGSFHNNIIQETFHSAMKLNRKQTSISEDLVDQISSLAKSKLTINLLQKTHNKHPKNYLAEIKTENSFVISSVVFGPEQRLLCQCGLPQKHSVKRTKFIDVKTEMKLLSQKITEAKEEIHILLQNFGYIIELAATNIANKTRTQVKKILQEKNQIILGLNKKVQYLQENILNAKTQRDEKIMKLIKDIESLTQNSGKIALQNKVLKEENQRLKLAVIWSKQGKIQKKISQATSDSSQRGIKMMLEKNDSPSVQKFCSMDKSRIKKKTTMVENVEASKESFQKSGKLREIKSLGDIRLKINRLREQMSKGQ